MKKWFNTIYLVTTNENGTSSFQLSKDIRVTQKTAWYMLHRIRRTFQIQSFNNIPGAYKKNIREPMMKQINKPFDEVLKRLMKTDSREIKSLIFNKPSGDFNPETD